MDNPYRALTLDRIAFAEQFLLWAVRRWIAQFKRGQADLSELRHAFRLARAPDALSALDELLGTLATGAQRPLDMRCVKCRSIGADEVLLLSAVAALQAGDPEPCQAILQDWLAPAAARAALRPAMVFAVLLREAGLRLPLRQPVATAWPKQPLRGAAHLATVSVH